MAKWIEFTRDYDHRWESGAVTAYKKGMIVFAKQSVVDVVGDAAKPTTKPKADDPDDDDGDDDEDEHLTEVEKDS